MYEHQKVAGDNFWEGGTQCPAHRTPESLKRGINYLGTTNILLGAIATQFFVFFGGGMGTEWVRTHRTPTRYTG